MTANVISTAAEATLTVHDGTGIAVGHLVNGAFSLQQPLQARATSPAGTGGAFADIAGPASPLTLLTYSGPVSNDIVTITFSQAIGASEPLRTGSYSKALTFTLSTTTPCPMSVTVGPGGTTTDSCVPPPDCSAVTATPGTIQRDKHEPFALIGLSGATSDDPVLH